MSSMEASTLQAIKAALSSARIGSYEAAFPGQNPLTLYSWNTEVSGALLGPLHICEVVVRNAVAEALGNVYGEDWPRSASFQHSLPDPRGGYSPRRDLAAACRSATTTTGKVIPELKFVFWQKMFTSRHDTRIWDHHLRLVIRNADPALSNRQVRLSIYNDLEQVRELRNRIAHHEPIFRRDLNDDLSKIKSLIHLRCSETSKWLDSYEQATSLITQRPVAGLSVAAPQPNIGAPNLANATQEMT